LIAKKGIAIIFITHRLTEVMAVADSMTIYGMVNLSSEKMSRILLWRKLLNL